jgi:energy-coupling factor transport system ATP-binding protein
MASPLLTLRRAVVSYGPEGRPALGGVDLSVEPGSWTAICGANGSGKSTLLASLASVMPLASGSLERGSARVAILLQDPDNQFVAARVRHELALSVPGDVSTGDRERRIDDAAERFALAHLLERNPHRLSGGEKQRLALATVWLESPDVVLLDEPLAYLDRESRDLVIGFVRAMNRDGAAVVWATPGDDVSLATDAVVLDGGRVTYSGSAAACPIAVDVRPTPSRREPLPRSAAPVATIRDVWFSYGDAPVLAGVDLDVFGGECVGVLGKNSSGKSTLLLALGGALEPASGAITRSDRAPFYLPQSPERVFFAETVHEEIVFGLKRRGLGTAEIERRTRVSLEAVGLDPGVFARRSPFQLSVGEMRRVAFAIVNALEPGLMLLDEPASCLDRSGVAVLDVLLERRLRAGAAVVVASHDPSHLEGVCDRVVTLDDGRLQ